jgi:hypothetical protein
MIACWTCVLTIIRFVNLANNLLIVPSFARYQSLPSINAFARVRLPASQLASPTFSRDENETITKTHLSYTTASIPHHQKTMDSIKIEKDRSCALQVLEGHKPEERRLSHFEQPSPSITSHLPHESSPHDSTSTQASAASLWSGVLSQCGSAFSRATSVAPSLRSHKRQQ